jgi:hypothetical protein
MPTSEYDKADILTVPYHRLAARIFSALDVSASNYVVYENLENSAASTLLRFWNLLGKPPSGRVNRDEWNCWFDQISARLGKTELLELLADICWSNDIDVSDLIQEAYLKTTHRHLSSRPNALRATSNSNCCAASGCSIA